MKTSIVIMQVELVLTIGIDIETRTQICIIWRLCEDFVESIQFIEYLSEIFHENKNGLLPRLK